MTKKQSKTTAKEVKYIPDTAHIIKLNQELTEENSRLVERVDELNDMVAKAIEIKEGLLDEMQRRKIDYTLLRNELYTIKSKWWYKLFRNW